MKLKTFKKVAIANRGEVAVRILHACQELRLKTVLLHSEPDTQSRAFRMSDEQVCVGPAPTRDSYLHIQRNIQAAKAAGADAIHPGFGFLSENADFAQACEENGLTFIGPKPDSIRKMGDKVSARSLMEAAGVPVVPGYQGQDCSVATLQREAARIGFPMMIKATAGGGGRGLRVVHSAEQFEAALESAQREALAGFGSDRVFLEKYISGAKHIEFQIFGDQLGNYVHLFERECSVQRRHQKIIEEALAPNLDEDLRTRMGEAALRAAKAVNYLAAGTVEFLLHGNDFYFLEMNTRLQVEHPVTELVCGVDLVKAQILVAQGHPLPFKQKDLHPRGHAIECRLYAEDPYQNGIPSTGVLGPMFWPEGPGRRFEVGFEEGDEITPFYDPMIAKIIVWDEDRSRCINKMLRVLDDTVIFGVKTNIPLLKELLSHAEFRNGTMTTLFFGQHFSEGLQPAGTSLLKSSYLHEIVDQARKETQTQSGPGAGVSSGSQGSDPFLQQWRVP